MEVCQVRLHVCRPVSKVCIFVVCMKCLYCISGQQPTIVPVGVCACVYMYVYMYGSPCSQHTFQVLGESGVWHVFFLKMRVTTKW